MPLIRLKKRFFQIGFKQIKKIVPKGVNSFKEDEMKCKYQKKLIYFE